MDVRKLPGLFGVQVDGLDLNRDMSDQTIGALIDLLHEHQIMVIRRQSLCDPAYVQFGHFWGQPLNFFVSSQTRDDFPEIIKQNNHADTPMNLRDGAGHWHSDSTYEEIPASVTMLYGVEAPDIGGETLIANTTLAYDALSSEMKSRIEPFVGMHCLSGAPPLPGENFVMVPHEIARMGIQRHPLVMRHPVTGRKALFTSGSAFTIEGMDQAEGRDLIRALRAHTTQPCFTTSYKVEVGDIFIWDNFQTMHSATPLEYSDDDGKRRLLYRISTKGLPDLRGPANAA